MKSLLKQDLQAVRAVVAKGWTQGAMAKDIKGNKTLYFAEDAVCWCLIGSLCKSLETWSDARYEKMREFLAEGLGVKCLANWNDTKGRTQAEVLAAIDTAIENC